MEALGPGLRGWGGGEQDGQSSRCRDGEGLHCTAALLHPGVVDTAGSVRIVFLEGREFHTPGGRG